MFKNIGKAMAAMLGTHAGGAPTVPHKRVMSISPAMGILYGSKAKPTRVVPAGHAKGRTTAAAQKRAKIKRANKRKNPKGTK